MRPLVNLFLFLGEPIKYSYFYSFLLIPSPLTEICGRLLALSLLIMVAGSHTCYHHHHQASKNSAPPLVYKWWSPNPIARGSSRADSPFLLAGAALLTYCTCKRGTKTKQKTRISSVFLPSFTPSYPHQILRVFYRFRGISSAPFFSGGMIKINDKE